MGPITPAQMEKLRELIEKSEPAKHVLETIAVKERPRDTSDLRRLKQEMQKVVGAQMTADTFFAVFDSFQKLKLGKLFRSDKPEVPSRFEWAVNYLTMARETLGITSVTPKSGGAVQERQGWMSVPLRVRDAVETLSLPVDLSKAEAEEICTFIRMYGR